METMTNRLYNAAYEGSVTALLELLQQDRLILDRMASLNGITETPLHVAAILGHTDFVKEILHRKPQLAKELDSKRSSPLHLASAKGHVEIVKALVVISPALCHAGDRDGRNPIQLAAMNGRVDVLVELLRVAPDAARNTAGQGETILHLCVKHNQLEALRLLVEVMGDYELVNAKDDYGMNILHLAVADKQIETTKFLVTSTKIEVNAVSANGFTALDILAQSHRDIKDFDISECLRNMGALRTTEIPPRGGR
ncbi:ankyrin repeat-containing protein BDA1 [Ziziphus jujuba]|uniref:Ankyrin repeat-containing protein BDA1 n=1 Tax=Ziziphus jujuba TaxID=326968 RepID=A0ABM3IL79_ZIZJJ|nr:ankyrin repeat-containing protein BDA1 [Ziziphus jujuba]